MYKILIYSLTTILLLFTFTETSFAQYEDEWDDHYEERDAEDYDDENDGYSGGGDYDGSGDPSYDEDIPAYFCEECQEPEDYRNFAGNTARFGNFDDLSAIDQFYIINPDGDRALADINLMFRQFGFEGFSIPYWPAGTYEIVIQLPNGDMVSYIMHRLHGVLPVPYSDQDSPETPSDNSGGGDEEDNDDGEEDYYDDDDSGWEYWEDDDGPGGNVTIEDPDENGYFDEWQEEE